MNIFRMDESNKCINCDGWVEANRDMCDECIRKADSMILAGKETNALRESVDEEEGRDIFGL